MKLVFFHNILWAHYKGAVFTELVPLANGRGLDVEIVQISETSGQRKSLSGVDLSYHQYPYTLLFKGAYDDQSWLARANAMVRYLRRSRPDVVVLPGYYDRAFWVALAYCMIARVRCGITMDSTAADHPRYWFKELPKKFFLRFCDFALCYGTRSKEYLQQLGMPSRRLFLRCQAAPVKQLLAVSRQVAVPPRDVREAPYFLYVGRLSPEKGLEDLLAAYAGFCRAGHEHDLLIIGGGPMESQLKQQTTELGLAHKVRFLGPMDMASIVPFYMHAYALVLPSLSEPWGLVVNEAMLFGCPVVVSDNCGCVPDLVKPMSTGLVFRAGDSRDLENALVQMAAMKETRAAYGDRCRVLIEAFTPRAAAAQMLDGALSRG